MTERAQHGKIDVPQLGSIPVLVDLVTGHATATLLVRPLRGLDEVVGDSVGIDIATSRGLLHVEARVAGVRDGELLDLEIADEGELVQRRAFARVDAVLEVTVASPPGGAERIAAAAVNISGSGAVVARLGGLTIGEAVSLSLRLAPLEPPILISGRIVREFGEHLRAIHFEQLQQSDRERIVRYVFERQRLELQRIKRP
jgi:PilZ domain